MHFRRLACGACMVGVLAAAGTAWAQSPAPEKAPRADILPPVIPIFPLEDATLFPNASRPFHIFEPRYRAMVADALKGDRIIGMVTLKPGYEANYDGRPPIYAIGCAGVITGVDELPDGGFDIVLRGIVKFRVTGEDPGRPYRIARVEALPEAPGDAETVALHTQRQRLEVLVTRPGSGPTIPRAIPDEEVVDALAEYVPLDPPERQALLELKGALARSQALIKLLEPTGTPPR